MKFMIFPYTQNSESATALAADLGGKRILRQGSSYEYNPDDVVINWGASDCPAKYKALNADIKGVLDKLSFFKRLAGKGLTPEFATSMQGAQALGYPVFCRTQIKGRDGAGIVVADKNSDLVQAPLYVKGIDKTSEYRIHIGRLPDGGHHTIGVQKKRKLAQTVEMTNIPADNRVWCGDTTSFVWTVNGFPVTAPSSVMLAVDNAFDYFPELTFGAFDVIYDSSTGRAYVIEINSAPMATPLTTKAYGDFFRLYSQSVEQVTPQETATEVAEAPVTVGQAQAAFVQNSKVEEVLNDLNNEKISLKTIIEGYILHVQG
jgi:hypothetical protein